MTARTARITGLAAGLTVAVALAGCGPTDDAAAVKSAPPVSPSDKLLKAVPDSDAAPYKFEIKQNNQKVTGTWDATKKSFEGKVVYSEASDGIDLTVTETTLVRTEGTWMKIAFNPSNLPGLPKLPKSWMKVDTSKVKDAAGNFLVFDENSADPGNAYFLVTNAAGVKEAGAGKYTGTTDITMVPDAGIVDEATLKALGAKAKAVPFTAAVDSEGHLSSMSLKVPAAGKSKAGTYTVTYSDFGKASLPAAPAADEQKPAPDAAYDLMNG
jgi:hypothetical protein